MTPTDEPTILAVDIGTSAIRATVLSLTGDVLTSNGLPTPIERARPDEAILDAERCWRLTAQAVRRAATGHRVAAVGVSAQLGLVLVDRHGAALTPIFLWPDRTADGYLDDVGGRLADSPVPLGRRLAVELPGVRLRMLAATQPHVVDDAAAILSVKDYVVARLTGEHVTDPTHASYTLVFDVARGRWSSELARRLDVPGALLPPVRRADDVAGWVGAAASVACGVGRGTVVAVGGPDGTIGSLGAGATAPGRTVDIAGSTDVLVHVTDAPVFDDRGVLTTNAHPLPALWTVGGATGLTGGAIAWLAGLFGYPGVEAMYEDLDRALLAVPAGSRGVLVDTALTGHRFPYWDLRRVGSIRGLTADRRREDILSAAQEGAAFLMADGLRALAAAGRTVDSVVVVGGVARRPDILRLRSSTWGLPVEGVGDGMATSRGAAMLAGVAAGLYSSVEDAARHLIPRGEVYEPDARARASLADAYAAWAAAFSHDAAR
ncbi:FGGY-family carbohydrate kinase [Georgenia sp. AZ-5]|uniref:xylulokinase n=1 Tax=Georgenia sp. AZ-5 TaxID=3367526 RepID=UPI00375538AC